MPSVSVIAAAALGSLVLTVALPGPAAGPGPAPGPGPAAAPVPPAATVARAVPAVPVPVPLAVSAVPGSRPAPRAASWRWPVPAPHPVLRRFAVGPHRWSAGHRGVDIAASPGSPVLAPAPGRVRFVGVVAGQPVLSIDHGDLISTYEPVSSALTRGDVVASGDVVGTLSALPGHCSPAACLHWGVRRGETYLDPLSLLGVDLRPVVLKPMGGPW